MVGQGNSHTATLQKRLSPFGRCHRPSIGAWCLVAAPWLDYRKQAFVACCRLSTEQGMRVAGWAKKFRTCSANLQRVNLACCFLLDMCDRAAVNARAARLTSPVAETPDSDAGWRMRPDSVSMLACPESIIIVAFLVNLRNHAYESAKEVFVA